MVKFVNRIINMLEYSKEQILELYKSLPKELKNAFDAEETIDALEKVSNDYKLSGKDTDKLVAVVSQVLLGLLSPNEFEKELGFEKEMAKKLILLSIVLFFILSEKV